jgi:hypothetical protein
MTETEKKLNHLITASIEVNKIESAEFLKMDLETIISLINSINNLEKIKTVCNNLIRKKQE